MDKHSIPLVACTTELNPNGSPQQFVPLLAGARGAGVSANNAILFVMPLAETESPTDPSTLQMWDNSQATLPATEYALITAALALSYDPVGEAYARTAAASVDAATVDPTGLMAPIGASFLYAFGSTTQTRLRASSATNQALVDAQAGALQVAQVGNWSINHTPAANTQATISRAAGAAGVRHVATSITATLSTLTAGVSANVLVNLRDGATGAGTILWSTRLVISFDDGVPISGVSIPLPGVVGSAATAMTLEFSAGPGANGFEAVALTGYSTSG
jgi:hypothetical protein